MLMLHPEMGIRVVFFCNIWVSTLWNTAVILAYSHNVSNYLGKNKKNKLQQYINQNNLQNWIESSDLLCKETETPTWTRASI